MVVTVDGQRYTVERTEGHAPGTVVERFPGIGLVGSEREWIGHTWRKTPKWYAAVNPSGLPGKVTATADGFMSRRAALAWLLRQAND